MRRVSGGRGCGSPYAAAIEEAEGRGAVVDGHTTGARGKKLAASGLRSCHEATTADEALERLRLGLWTPLRYSSVRPDLPELLPLLTEKDADTRRVLLTADGPSPDAVAERGYIDRLLRLLVEAGVEPVSAIQLATVNAATYLKLDDHVGGVAPGRLADLVLLEDLSDFRPELVIAGGEVRARRGKLTGEPPSGLRVDWAPIGLETKFASGGWIGETSLYDARSLESVPAVKFVSDVITRAGDDLELSPSVELPEGYLHGAHVDRFGEWVTCAVVGGFASGLGGLATTATSSGYLLALGRDPEAMALAASRVREMGGGVAVAADAGVVWEAALPLAGIVAAEDFGEALEFAPGLKAVLRCAGCPYEDPLYSLLFLTADFLPGPRFTVHGVLDVASGKLLAHRETIGT